MLEDIPFGTVGISTLELSTERARPINPEFEIIAFSPGISQIGRGARVAATAVVRPLRHEDDSLFAQQVVFDLFAFFKSITSISSSTEIQNHRVPEAIGEINVGDH